MVNALSSFTSVLSAELAAHSVPVTHLQLGTFDFSSMSPRSNPSTRSNNNDASHWARSVRSIYTPDFAALDTGLRPASGCGSASALGKGTSLRVLNDAVFDYMTEGSGGTVRIGMGSSIYHVVGAWAPRGLIAWMLGVKSQTPPPLTPNAESRAKRKGRSSLLLTSGKESPGTPQDQWTSVENDDYLPVYSDVEGLDAWKDEQRASPAALARRTSGISTAGRSGAKTLFEREETPESPSAGKGSTE